MSERLVVAEDPAMGDAYLAQLLDAERHGHGPEILPAVRVLRMLRFPMQHAVAPGWTDRAVTAQPLRFRDVARLRLIRNAEPPDLDVLSRFADYAASVRAAAFVAMRGADPGERFRIGLQLTGPPRRPRSVYILSKTEVISLCEIHGAT